MAVIVVLPNSYGDTSMVAEIVARYTRGGVFSEDTNPTDQAVIRWINQISAIMNTLMAGAGFKIPITQDDVLQAMEGIVIDHVADMCHRSNSSGRYFTDKALRTKNPMSVIHSELGKWVEMNAPGFENLGAERTSAFADIGFREFDESGGEIAPIFQEDGFGNTFNDG